MLAGFLLLLCCLSMLWGDETGGGCNNIALFLPFPHYSDDLRSLQSLRCSPSDPAPAPTPFRSPCPLSLLPVTHVLYYGLFPCDARLYSVFPHACSISHSLLDSP